MKRHNWIEINEKNGRKSIHAVCSKCGCQNTFTQTGNSGMYLCGSVRWIEQYELDGQAFNKMPSCK